VALAIIIAIATVIFWRRSKPAAVSAESALAGDDASATGSGLAAGSAWADTDQPTPDPDSPFAQAPRPLPEPAPQPDPAGAAPEPLEVASAATLAAATASLVPDAENDAKSADVPASRDEAAEESPSEPSESAHAAAGDTWLASDFQERLTDEPPERAEPPPFSED